MHLLSLAGIRALSLLWPIWLNKIIKILSNSVIRMLKNCRQRKVKIRIHPQKSMQGLGGGKESRASERQLPVVVKESVY